MKDKTIVIKTDYDYIFIKSIEKSILEEIRSIGGISTARMALNQKKLGTDFKIHIWFLNDQEINKRILETKISLILKNQLDHFILAFEGDA